MTVATVDLKRLTKDELAKLGTPEAAAELERRKARKRVKGAAYGERTDAEVQRAMGEVLAMFESGDLPDRVAQTVLRRKASDAPMGQWSLMNQLIVLIAGTDDARGRRQWAAAGREVRKGAKPIIILGPRMVKWTKENEDTGEVETGTAMKGFVGVQVFAVEDTDGDPLTGPADYTPPVLPPLFDVAARLGVSVRWAGAGEGVRYRGWYSHGGEIMLLTHDESTWFHELSHAAHNAVLKARGRSLTGGQVASQEIVAETCAAVLCRLYGLDGYIWHGHQYVASYAKATGGDLRRKVASLLGEIAAALALILDIEVAS